MNNRKTAEEMYDHLTGSLIPFWEGLRDDEFGGFYGYMGHDLKTDRRAVKGCILNSRILWFFSNAYIMLTGQAQKGRQGAREQAAGCLACAEHAFDFMMKYCVDREQGGVLWAVNYDGSIADDVKHTYNQAFAVYALSAYYDATGSSEALGQAMELYDVIESRCADEAGYLEAFGRDFTPTGNDKLSENGVSADRTMNTWLHVTEAYTALLRALKRSIAEDGSQTSLPDRSSRALYADKVAASLMRALDIYTDIIYNPSLRRQEVFFDSEYRSLIDLHSYGHDIEASWLTDEACEVLGDAAYTERMAPITLALAENIYIKAYRRHSLMNECVNGVEDTHRIWWVQAETVVGFVNAAMKLEKAPDLNSSNRAERLPDSALFMDAAADVWDFIKAHVIDKREGSEWFWELDDDAEPVTGRAIVDPWKCPYHNGRMCMELIRRLG